MVYIRSYANVQNSPDGIYTCRELSIVNIQANTTVLLLIANSPNTQVLPSKGIRSTAAFSDDLQYRQWKIMIQCMNHGCDLY